MGMIEDVRSVLQDIVTPDMKAIEARLTALEKNYSSLESTVKENESRAEKRHAETMMAIRDTANYVHIVERLARLEEGLRKKAS